MTFEIKRIYEPAASSDGTRVLARPGERNVAPAEPRHAHIDGDAPGSWGEVRGGNVQEDGAP